MESLSEDAKIIDLEIRLTHQEATIEELNRVLLEQHGLIESLKADVARLKRQFQDISASNVADISQETPPPHY